MFIEADCSLHIDEFMCFWDKKSEFTMSGRHMDSHMPRSESGAVPATMKSFAVSIAPIESVPAKYGVNSCPFLSSPAITGLTKYGPNLTAKGEISLFPNFILFLRMY